MVNLSGQIQTYWDNNHIYLPLTPDELQGEIDGYDGAIAFVDEQIGDLLANLQKRGLKRDTLLIIVSDHGEAFGEHSLFQHLNALYREVIYVPLIIWWPGHVPAGVRIDQPISIASIPATLLDLIGENNQTNFPLPSLAKLWEDPNTEWKYPISELAFIPWSPPNNPSAHGSMKSVISPNWQYILHEKFGSEIYNWRDDPEEVNNLINDPKMQEIIAQSKDYLNGLLANASH